MNEPSQLGDSLPPRTLRNVVSVGLVVGTALYNTAQNLVLASWSYAPTNAAATVVLYRLASSLGLERRDIGLERWWSRSGARCGGAAAGIALILLVAGALTPATRGLFMDSRVVDVGLLGLLYETLLRIPLGTALFEEVLFRGVLLAWFIRLSSPLRGVVYTSVLFGFWHLIPTWQAIPLYQNGTLANSGTGLTVAVLAGVLGTTTAGFVLCWLRLKSGTLIAPVLAHAALNSGAFATSYVLAAVGAV